jgi:hypothetical protein
MTFAKSVYMECISDEIRRLQASTKMCDGSAAQPCEKPMHGVHKRRQAKRCVMDLPHNLVKSLCMECMRGGKQKDV